MMATANVSAVIKDLKTRVSAIAIAMISRDGQVLYADVPAGVYTETFAIMCATVLGAAVTANTELGRAPPERIMIEGNDSTTLIVGSGTKALLIAMVDRMADVVKVGSEVTKFADLLQSN
jgi:uncharacterized protein